MVGIIDYGLGNLSSVFNAFNAIDCHAEVFDNPKNIKKYTHLILPGVGSFDAAMEKLNNSGLRDTLDEFVINRDLPLLGVCIGMHMLGRSSEEGSMGGLSYISGHTEKMSFIDSNISTATVCFCAF